MGKFNIDFVGNKIEVDGDFVLTGELRMGEFCENFHASLSYWNEDFYKLQWTEGLKRLLNGCEKSALVTTMYNPETANFIFWWVMYLIDNNVYIQNHVLFLDELCEKFEEKNIYKYVPNRELKTDESEKVSEWIVSINEISEFLKMNEAKL